MTPSWMSIGIVDVSPGANQSASGTVGSGTGDCGAIGGVVALMPEASRGRCGGGGGEIDGDGNGDGDDGGVRVAAGEGAPPGAGVGDANGSGELDAVGTADALCVGTTLGGGNASKAFEAPAFAAMLQITTIPPQTKFRRFTGRAFAPRRAADLYGCALR